MGVFAVEDDGFAGGGIDCGVDLLACVALGSREGSPTLIGISTARFGGFKVCCCGPGSSSPVGAGSGSPGSMLRSGPSEVSSPG